MNTIRRRSAVLAILTGAVLLASCSAAATPRPDPNAVVKGYLTALSHGDARGALALDAAAVRSETGDEAKSIDTQALRTDAVLAHATARITDVSVDAKTRQDGSDHDVRRVSFAFTLDGKKQQSSLDVRWDQAASKWVLQQSLTVRLSVDAVQAKAAYEPAPFQLTGAAGPFSADPQTAPVAYLAYPGVYQISTTMPATQLAPGAAATQPVTATPGTAALVIFPVLTLPSNASK